MKSLSPIVIIKKNKNKKVFHEISLQKSSLLKILLGGRQFVLRQRLKTQNFLKGWREFPPLFSNAIVLRRKKKKTIFNLIAPTKQFRYPETFLFSHPPLSLFWYISIIHPKHVLFMCLFWPIKIWDSPWKWKLHQAPKTCVFYGFILVN